MKLIDCIIDLKSNDVPQPVVIHEANKNAYVVFAEFGTKKGNTPKHIKLEGIKLWTYSLIADGKYVFVKCADYVPKSTNKGRTSARVMLKLGISDYPVLEKNITISPLPGGLVDEFALGKKEYIDFHISFDTSFCDDTGTGVNNGDWPCNQNLIA